MAWVKLKPEATGHERRAGRLLPRAASPPTRSRKFWKFVDGFPMTVTGKIQKYKMRESSVTELGLDVAAAVKTA